MAAIWKARLFFTIIEKLELNEKLELIKEFKLIEKPELIEKLKITEKFKLGRATITMTSLEQNL